MFKLRSYFVRWFEDGIVAIKILIKLSSVSVCHSHDKINDTHFRFFALCSQVQLLKVFWKQTLPVNF